MLWSFVVMVILISMETYQFPFEKFKDSRDAFHDPTIIQAPIIDLSEDFIEEANSSDTNLNLRFKRSTTPYYGQKRKTLKVMVVVDDSVASFHGNDKVDLYVHSMLSVVDQAFHHPSLGKEINIIPVRIYHLNTTEFKQIWKVKKSSDILKKFCEWTSEFKKNNMTDELIDINVYLTRENFGPAGYAPVHGVCHELRNCALVRDSGLSSAFVFAHEIGHNLGMNHDGDGNKCSPDADDGRIMGPRVFSHFFAFRWTSCSREYLDKYLSYATCLDVAPEDPPIIRYSDTYGQNWSLDEQCRQEFGNDYAFCLHVSLEHSCRLLSCYKKNKYTGFCTTKNSPPMPGTICGSGKWCMDEYCVEKTNISIDGGWSLWQEWSPCSRSCGSGFQFRERRCNNPSPSEFGRPCRGPAEEFHTCNKEPCENTTDFRAEQCELHNEKTFLNKMRHHWLPYESDRSSQQCKLNCISRETGDTITEQLIDGTFCSYDNPHDRCFKGSCKSIGCDGVMYSQKKDDQCGHCGANGKGCEKVKGHFDDLLPAKEYHHLLVLPKNARNIIVRERHTKPHLAHFFALRDSNTETWYLNGKLTQSSSTKFVSNRAGFTYFNGFAEGESLASKGPLLSPLDFLVYSMSNAIPTWIEYEYTIPLNESSGFVATKESLKKKLLDDDDDSYVWAFSGWTNCSKSCGTGQQSEILNCLRRKTGSIADGFCSQQKLKPGKRECNTHSCNTRYWWYSEDWEHTSCSATCGNSGIQRRLIKCMTHKKGENVKIDPQFCDQRSMPVYARKCNRIPCNPPTSTTNRPPIDTEINSNEVLQDASNTTEINIRRDNQNDVIQGDQE